MSNESFRLLFDHHPFPMWMYDLETLAFLEVNHAAVEKYGYTREEFLKMTLKDIRPLEDQARLLNDVAETRGALQDSGEWRHRLRNGRVVDVEISSHTLAYRERNAALVIVQDITERKDAERLLRESEIRHRSLFTNMLEGFAYCRMFYENGKPVDFEYLEVNNAFEKITGLRDVTGKMASEAIPGIRESNPELFEIYGRVAQTGQSEQLEIYVKPLDIWFSISVYSIHHGYFAAVFNNITERKQAEEKTRHSEEQFRLIAENIADMIAVVDLEGRRIYNSPSYRSILGDPDALKGTDGFHEIHPDDVVKVKEAFQETVRTGIGKQLEYRFLLQDGSVRTIDSKGSVIRDRDGRIAQVIVVSRDVTEEKRLTAQYLRAQRMESIGTLAGGIAHDLNNVLAPIMMGIEILRPKLSDPIGQRVLSTIETSANRGSDIVKQVLAFGRGVEGDRILVQLKHVVNEVIKIAGGTFPKSISIHTDIPRDLWTVSADPTQMHQVLLNMLVNARDAMPDGGTLTVSAENITLDENYSSMHLEAQPGMYVCLSITDTGTGIPPEIRAKIFEPFFTTKAIGTGTGLGLSTTIAILKSHEGFIDLFSEMGRGTTFRIYVPATGTVSGVPVPGEDAQFPMGHGELILVIDDEAAIRDITRETLQTYGYKAMTASDGAEGVAIFAENKQDIKVVITDMMMPVMDGTAAILVLKKLQPDVKIIAASGLAIRGEVTTPTNSGVQGFLTKPYTAEQLLKSLKEVLR